VPVSAAGTNGEAVPLGVVLGSSAVPVAEAKPAETVGVTVKIADGVVEAVWMMVTLTAGLGDNVAVIVFGSVGVAVRLGVAVDVGVYAWVAAVAVRVTVGVLVRVAVADGVSVCVAVGVLVAGGYLEARVASEALNSVPPDAAPSTPLGTIAYSRAPLPPTAVRS
jgi:hypothetical protein